MRTGASRYAPGQVVHIAFVVANHTQKSVAYDFPTTQQCDFFVSDAYGKTVWRWSHGHVFSQRLTRFSLPAGGRKLFQVVWNGRSQSGGLIPLGLYRIHAILTSTNRPAITGGVIVNTETDPNNIGIPTQTPAESGAIRQGDVTPPVTAGTTITIVPTRFR